MSNLAVSGYDIRDIMAPTAATERERMQALPPSLLHLVARNSGQLMGLYVLECAVRRASSSTAQIDFGRLISRDTLISDPPACITPDLRLLGWANEVLDWVKRMGRIFGWGPYGDAFRTALRGAQTLDLAL